MHEITKSVWVRLSVIRSVELAKCTSGYGTSHRLIIRDLDGDLICEPGFDSEGEAYTAARQIALAVSEEK